MTPFYINYIYPLIKTYHEDQVIDLFQPIYTSDIESLTKHSLTQFPPPETIYYRIIVIPCSDYINKPDLYSTFYDWKVGNTKDIRSYNSQDIRTLPRPQKGSSSIPLLLYVMSDQVTKMLKLLRHLKNKDYYCFVLAVSGITEEQIVYISKSFQANDSVFINEKDIVMINGLKRQLNVTLQQAFEIKPSGGKADPQRITLGITPGRPQPQPPKTKIKTTTKQQPPIPNNTNKKRYTATPSSTDPNPNPTKKHQPQPHPQQQQLLSFPAIESVPIRSFFGPTSNTYYNFYKQQLDSKTVNVNVRLETSKRTRVERNDFDPFGHGMPINEINIQLFPLFQGSYPCLDNRIIIPFVEQPFPPLTPMYSFGNTIQNGCCDVPLSDVITIWITTGCDSWDNDTTLNNRLVYNPVGGNILQCKASLRNMIGKRNPKDILIRVYFSSNEVKTAITLISTIYKECDYNRTIQPRDIYGSITYAFHYCSWLYWRAFSLLDVKKHSSLRSEHYMLCELVSGSSSCTCYETNIYEKHFSTFTPLNHPFLDQDLTKCNKWVIDGNDVYKKNKDERFPTSSSFQRDSYNQYITYIYNSSQYATSPAIHALAILTTLHNKDLRFNRLGQSIFCSSSSLPLPLPLPPLQDEPPLVLPEINGENLFDTTSTQNLNITFNNNSPIQNISIRMESPHSSESQSFLVASSTMQSTPSSHSRRNTPLSARQINFEASYIPSSSPLHIQQQQPLSPVHLQQQPPPIIYRTYISSTSSKIVNYYHMLPTPELCDLLFMSLEANYWKLAYGFITETADGVAFYNFEFDTRINTFLKAIKLDSFKGTVDADYLGRIVFLFLHRIYVR